MSRTYQVAKRDANEREMVEAWRALGGLWFAQPPGSGFDGILLTVNGVHFVEIKNKDGRGTKLTPNELRMKREIEARGAEYEIIYSIEQALALVGAG